MKKIPKKGQNMAKTKEMMYFPPTKLKKVITDMEITTRELCDLLDNSLGGVHYIKSKGRISVDDYKLLKREYKKRLKKNTGLDEKKALEDALKKDGRKTNSRKKPKKIDLSKVPLEELVAEVEKRKKKMKKQLEMTEKI